MYACIEAAKISYTSTHLDRVETKLKDSVQHAAVEALLFLEVLLELKGDGVQALGAAGGVPLLHPPIAGQQVLHHHSAQALPVCIQPAHRYVGWLID